MITHQIDPADGLTLDQPTPEGYCANAGLTTDQHQHVGDECVRRTRPESRARVLADALLDGLGSTPAFDRAANHGDVDVQAALDYIGWLYGTSDTDPTAGF